MASVNVHILFISVLFRRSFSHLFFICRAILTKVRWCLLAIEMEIEIFSKFKLNFSIESRIKKLIQILRLTAL